MIRQSLKVSGAILTVLLLLAGTAWAGGAYKHGATSEQMTEMSNMHQTSIAATVQSMDARQGTLTLATASGNIVDLQVSQELLGTLVEGDRVEVTIRQKPAGPKSDMRDQSGMHDRSPSASQQKR